MEKSILATNQAPKVDISTLLSAFNEAENIKRSLEQTGSSKPTREELLDLYAAGETKMKDIAALCGVEEATVFRWLKSYKIPTRTSVRFSRVHLPERSR